MKVCEMSCEQSPLRMACFVQGESTLLLYIIIIIMYVHYCMVSPLNITVCVSIALFLCGPGSLVMLRMKWGLFNWLKPVGHVVLNTSWKRR